MGSGCINESKGAVMKLALKTKTRSCGQVREHSLFIDDKPLVEIFDYPGGVGSKIIVRDEKLRIIFIHNIKK